MIEEIVMTYQLFDSYVLFDQVAADKLGHLYRAGELVANRVKRRVWLRLFDADQIPARDLVEGFDEAAQIGATLRASNLIPNPSFFEHDGTPAMVWDYIPGQPLPAVLERAREIYSPFTTGNALLLVCKLASAVTAGLGVEVEGGELVHGFLHPAFVFVTNDGQVQLSGLGIADRLVDLVDSPEVSEALHPFLAPEVINKRMIGKRADVYSLGAILFQLLTGRALPAQLSARDQALSEAQLGFEEQPIPPELRALLERSLAVDPGMRFSSAAELFDLLRKLKDDDRYGSGSSTFDLALLMFQLFRREIEAEEDLKTSEIEVDIEPDLSPEPEEIAPPEAVGRGGKGLWIGIAAVGAAIIIAALLFVQQLQSPPQSTAPPTPTPEELEAQSQARAERLAAMVEAEVTRLMGEKEEEIRQELIVRQTRIEDLKRRLDNATASSSRAGAGPTAAEQRQAEQLRRELEAAEEEKRRREAELAQQLQQAQEMARREQEAALAAAEQAQLPTQTGSEEAAAAEESASPAAAPAAPTPYPKTPIPAPLSTPDTSNRRAEERTTQPVKIRGASPAYPDAALRMRISGEVVLKLLIDEQGTVKKVDVAKGLPMGLTESATKAVKKWKFKPATRNGKPVEAIFELTIKFNPS
jgi:serine/threonine-protein kinase